MKLKAIISISLLAFVAVALVFIVLKNTGSTVPAETAQPGQSATAQQTSGPAAAAAPEHQFVATYFHNNIRCPSCIKIERLSREAIHASFSEQLEAGGLVYRTVNIDQPEHKHFIDEYSLYTKHLIITEQRRGKDVRWLDLPRVWDLLGDEDSFKAYVRDGIERFMAAEPGEGQAAAVTTSGDSS